MAANWSLSQVIAQLNSGRKWSGNTITYAFPTTASGMFNQGEGAGFRPVNSNQQALMVLAMATWDDLMPQSFAPGAVGTSNIEFGYTNTSIGYAHAYFPTVGSVYFNANEASLVSTAIGQYGFQTYIHEIGHALGLNHMGDYNGNGNWSPSSFQDSVVLSIMSYFGPRSAAPNYSAEVMQANWVGANGQTFSPQTPMVNDVLAIQSIYGTSTTTRSGNTVYGFNSNVDGALRPILDFTLNRNPILTIFDSGGIDTLDLSGWSSPSRIDLTPGAYSAANGMTNNIAIAYSTTIENAIGGPGNDVIRGNTAANRLEGGAGNDELYGGDGDDVLVGGPGNDLLDGGAGTDTAIFFGNYFAYTVTVSGNTVLLSSAAEGNDRAVSIERFQFADGLRLLTELSPAGDTTAPVLQTLSPPDNAASVAMGANLVLSFNEAVKAGNGNITILNANGTVFRSIAISDTTQVRFEGNSVVIDPAVNLVGGQAYVINIAAGAITDMAGNPYAGISGTTAWNFSTVSVDTAPPQTISLSPADDVSGVAAGANLVLQFNEAVVAGNGNIVIRSGNQVIRTIAVTDTSQVTISGSTVTINPAADLPAGAAISVTIDAGALRDQAGNAFAGISLLTGWNFTVAGGQTDDYPYSVDTPGVVVVNGAASSGAIEIGGDRDLFRVQLTAGVAYSFTLQRTAGGLSDPYLVLWDPNLNLVAEDDDSGGAGNSRIGYTPTTSGTFYLAVWDYAATGTGAYTIRAVTQDTQAPTLVARSPADDAVAVPVGADLVLTFSEPVLAGSGVIRLVDNNGSVLREIRADSAAVRINGSTVTVDPGDNLPAGRAFSVTIDSSAFRDLAGNTFAGISSLTAWNFTTAAVNVADDYPMAVDTQGLVVVNGAPSQARIDYANDGDLFRVNLNAGVTYRFDMLSAAGSPVDPFLMLYGTLPEVDLIGYDDDSGPRPLDSRLFFTPSQSGLYYLAAFDYAEAVGRYSITAITPPDDYLGSTATTGRLTINTFGVSGRIDVPSDVDMFAVTLTAGQEYTFELWTAANFGLRDPYLVLTDFNGTQLALDDDTGVGLESLLTYRAAASGTYYLAAMDYGAGIGNYELWGYTRNVIRGTLGNDTLVGTGGRDTLEGSNGNDLLRGQGGDDILRGGNGIDIGRYSGPVNNYYLENMGEGAWVVRDLVGSEGRDLTYDVERLLFDDGYWALDVDGNAGTTVMILGAVFGAASVRNEAYVGIGLSLLDAGMSEQALMQLALDARLGAGARPAAVVNLLWSNLFGSLPDTPTRLAYEGLISNGTYTAAGLGLAAAATEWNLKNIDFVGIVEQGVGYSL